MNDPIKDKLFSTLRIAFASMIGAATQMLLNWGIPDELIASTIGPTLTSLVDPAAFIVGTVVWYFLGRWVETVPWLSRLLVFKNPTLDEPRQLRHRRF